MFDLVFFVFVGILCFNVMTGLIFSTFGKLRAELNARENVLNNEIFVSGISRTKYADLGLSEAPSFDELASSTQHYWNYVNLVLYLQLKNPVDYTGLDTFIKSKIDDEKIDWLPVKNTFHMQLMGAKYDQPPGSGPPPKPKGDDDDDDDDADAEGKAKERRRPKDPVAGALFDFTAGFEAVKKEVEALSKRLDVMERKADMAARQNAAGGGGGGGGGGAEDMAEEALGAITDVGDKLNFFGRK